MKHCKKIVCLFLAVVLLLSVAAAYDTNAISFTLLPQEKDNWCWASCTQGIVKYYNPQSTYSQVVLYALAYNTTVANWRDVGASMPTVSYLFARCGYTTSYRDTLGGPIYSLTKQEIDAGRPFLIFNKLGQTEKGHVVTGTGYNLGGSNICYIGYRDPQNGSLMTCNVGVGGGSIFYYDSSSGRMYCYGTMDRILPN